MAILAPAFPALAQQQSQAPAAAPTSTPVPAPTPPASDTPAPVVVLPGDNDLSELRQSAGQIVVVAGRIKGQVEVPQAPIMELNEEDIAAYGATSISDLLDQLSPQTSSGRGRSSGGPVILLNGQRISSFRELRDFPPEAIRRVEILPEEVALRYGYPPDQRVVNIILKDKFQQKSVGVEYGIPTLGGFHTAEIESRLTRIAHGARMNINAKYNDTSPLTQAERGIATPASSAPDVAGDPDPAAYNSLIADSQNYSLNANWSKGLGRNGIGGQISFNAALSRADTLNLNGLNAVVLTAPDGSSARRTTLEPQPLATVKHVTTAQTGASFNKAIGAWQFTATADYTHTDTRSRIDRAADLSALQTLAASGALSIDAALPSSAIVAFAPDRAVSNTDAATTLLTMMGRPVHLPGGDVMMTFNAGYAYSDITSSDARTTTGGLHLKRGDAQAGANIALPITSRRNNFGSALGDISLNFNAGLHQLSDFGTLYNYGAGLTWGLTEKLTFTSSYIAEDQAPGLSDLGGPITVTPGVAVYDFSTGQTVLATVTTGGNADLVREKQRDWKFGLTWTLPFLSNSNVLVEYFRNHSSGTTNAFPLLTAAVEAAYPGRVTRDASGQIVSVDERAVTFADERSSSLRYGFNLGGSFGKADPKLAQRRGGAFGGPPPGGGPGGPPPGGGPGGGGGPRPGGGGPGGGGRGPGGDGRGRWNISIYHTVTFDKTAQLVAGSAVLDLLGGDAITGGTPRHAVTMEGGGFYRGFGLRLSGTLTGGSHINASGLPGSSRLDFAPIATFNLRAFANLDQQDWLTKAVPFFKNSRLMLKVDNLFDGQQKVTDGTGTTPLRYLPGYEDPQGRVITIDFRKMF